MSKITKKKHPKRMRKPKNRTAVEVTSGIVWRDDKDETEKQIASKIIFLGKENLEEIRGYKAFLDLWSDGQVCLTITGLNPQSGSSLFDSIDKMKDEEILGE